LQIRCAIEEATANAFHRDPDFTKTPLSKLNAEAVALHKAGHHVAAVAAFAKLFERARMKNLVHAELHVCYR
jgi:hypothetical protein